MLTSEDMKRIKKDPNLRIRELENSLSIALEVNNKYQRENAALLKNRPLDTMDEVAYRELQVKNEELTSKCKVAGRAMIELNLKYEANIKELDRLSEENTNLKVMMKGKK